MELLNTLLRAWLNTLPFAARLQDVETELAVSKAFAEHWASAVIRKEGEVTATTKDMSLAEVNAIMHPQRHA